MITKQGNKPEIDNLSCHTYVVCSSVAVNNTIKLVCTSISRSKSIFISLTYNFFYGHKVQKLPEKINSMTSVWRPNISEKITPHKRRAYIDWKCAKFH